MTAKILKENVQVLHLSTYRPLNETELTDANELAEQSAFDKNIKTTIGQPMTQERLKTLDSDTPTYPHFHDAEEEEETQFGNKREGAWQLNEKETQETTPEDLDNNVGAQVNLPRQGCMMSGAVKRRARTADGQVMGMANDNPILDTRKYIVKFPDGYESLYMANLIAENMYTQCDVNSNQCLVFKAIIDHKYDEETRTWEEEEVTHQREKLRGWMLAVEWKDGSTSWERLSDLNESFPIEVAN